MGGIIVLQWPTLLKIQASSLSWGPSSPICADCGVPKHPSPPAYLSHTSVNSASWLVFCSSESLFCESLVVKVIILSLEQIHAIKFHLMQYW